MKYIADNATLLRGSFFLTGILLFSMAGILFPYRTVDLKRESFRWLNNLSLTMLNGLTTTLLVPFSLVYLAANYSHDRSLFGAGDTNLMYVVLQVVVLDLLIYCQHYLFHKIGPLWRLHRVHHSDTEFDATTALRFHTVEIYISFFIKALAVWTLGIGPVAVVIFEIVLNFSAMFNHGNFSLPRILEKMNLMLITPDMHRIHHSVDIKERDSNYGFFLSVWDRAFKTYRSESKHDLKYGKIGTPHFRELKHQSILRLLIQPFAKPAFQDRDKFLPQDLKKSG